MPAELDDLNKKMEEFLTVLKLGTQELKKIETPLRETAKLNKQLRDAEDAVLKAIREKTKHVKGSNEALRIAKRELKDLIIIEQKALEVKRKLQKQTQVYANGLSALKGVYGTVTGAVTKFIGVLGASTISFGSIVKAGMDYDKTLFSLSRTQQIAGNSMDNLGGALTYVEKNTILSKDQFIELADSIAKTYVGIPPTISEMAKLAAMIQQKVGPSFDRIKDSAEKLMAVQSKFPALYKDIYKAMELMDKTKPGGATQAEIERGKALKDNIVLTQILRDASNDEIKNTLILLTEATIEQQELNQMVEKQQKLTQELRNAQLELYDSFRPLLIEGTKGLITIVNTFRAFKKEILIVGASIAGLMGLIKVGGAAMGIAKAFGVAAAAAGPIGLAVAGIIAAVAAAGALYMYFKSIDKKSEDMAKNTEIIRGINKKINSLTEEQRTKVIAILKTRREAGMSAEQEQRLALEVIAGVKAREELEKNVAFQIQEQLVNMEAYLGLLKMSESGLQGQIDSMEKFGLTAREQFKGLGPVLEKSLAELNEGTRGLINKVVKELKDKGITIKADLSVEGNLDEQTKQLSTQLTDVYKKNAAELEKGNLTEERSKTLKEENREIMVQQAALLKYTSQKQEMINKTIEARFNTETSEMRQMENFTSKYEARLETQRDLMEAAQFGLGASVAMMQKQVDLAYQQQETYRQTLENIQKIAKEGGNINDQQLDTLNNMEGQGQAENYIKNILGKTGDEAKILGKYYADQNEINDKMMQKQKKIYDLTKDIREGYLQSIREASTNAKEFTKIIGTQEMGVTQLMSMVKEATGEYKGNTMAMGGIINKKEQAESYASRTKVAGRYVTGGGGVRFLSEEDQEARNQSIYRYKESRERVLSGARSYVGTANVPGAGTYLAPERAGETGTPPPSVGNVPESLRRSINVKPGGTAPGSERAEDLWKNVGSTQGLSRGVIAPGMAQGINPISGGYTTAPGPFHVPGTADTMGGLSTGANRSIQVIIKLQGEAEKLFEVVKEVDAAAR